MPASNPKVSFMLDRLLFLLSTHHVLGCSVDDSNTRLYSINSVSKHFVCNQDGVSLGPFMALIQDEIFLQSWSHLKDAILKGEAAFEMVHGMQRYKYLGLDFRFNQVFSKAMYNQSTLWILQCWSDDECLKLLRNCYKAIPEDEKIIIVQGSLPAVPETSSGAKATCQLDVLLMTQSSAGGERTQQAYVDLAIKAGFGGIKFVKMVCKYG
ncbi:hypothetical protein K2173_001315 [Erythroxylum novogranatense]|uniref:O-methyltransferase C-terminal domain-containing protein n=1 Tax=Erythroxylum novogranatense TaxID=1862640 RepID=A0AAV8T4M0_9ROSI|nr:hypothetical protein K2173_001315 [Erythroxylum novogranatense]